MSHREVERKFISLAAPVLGDARAASVAQEVDRLERRESLKDLFSALGA
jgi:hypothetical protein